jgi:hypothetical protein
MTATATSIVNPNVDRRIAEFLDGLNSRTSLVTGRLGGLLWLLPTILICLVWSTYNAWSLAIHPARARNPGSLTVVAKRQ